MKSINKTAININIVGIIFIFFAQIQSSEANSQNKQEAQIKKASYEVTPIQSVIYSKDEHVRVTINDTLSLGELGLRKKDLLDYSIYLYVHPLTTDTWWRQTPVTASSKWSAQTYLGGVGEYSPKDGDVFQIVAVMAKLSPPEKVNKIGILKNEKDVKIISEIRTMTIKRNKPSDSNH